MNVWKDSDYMRCPVCGWTALRPFPIHPANPTGREWCAACPMAGRDPSALVRLTPSESPKEEG